MKVKLSSGEIVFCNISVNRKKVIFEFQKESEAEEMSQSFKEKYKERNLNLVGRIKEQPKKEFVPIFFDIFHKKYVAKDYKKTIPIAKEYLRKQLNKMIIEDLKKEGKCERVLPTKYQTRKENEKNRQEIIEEIVKNVSARATRGVVFLY